MKKSIAISLATVPTVFLASCFAPSSSSSALSGHAGVQTYRAYDRPAKLPSNPSNVRVKVSLKNQMTYVMEGSKPLMVMPVAVGTSGTPTPKGNFRIYRPNAIQYCPYLYYYLFWLLSNFDLKKMIFVKKKLDRSRSEGRGFMANHHLYKIWARACIKRHVHVSTCTWGTWHAHHCS